MIDLHLHTLYSDGSNTVEEIFKIAKSTGLKALAITDHDTLEAIGEALEFQKKYDIEFIKGVEISTRYKDGRELHILGYLFDEDNKELNEVLNWILDVRAERNKKLIKLLNDMGYSVTFDELIEIAEKEENIGRPHFAKLLLDKGYFKTLDEVFLTLLGEGKKGYIEKPAITPYKAIDIIHKAKGVVVLAHPLSYRFESKNLVEELIEDLVNHGLDGIEAEYVTYSLSDINWLKGLADKYNLIVTGGSDYHGKYKPHISLGKGLGSLRVPYKLVQGLYKRKEG